jgi:hypothetical protein
MVLVFFIASIYVLKARGGLGGAKMTKTGPNDHQTRRLGLRWVFFLFVFSRY